MRMTRPGGRAVVCVLAMFFCGCDRVVRVHWTLPPERAATVPDVCSAVLHVADSGEPLADARAYLGEEVAFMVGPMPKARSYFVTLECPGHQPWRSAEFVTTGDPDPAVPLGILELVRDPEP